MKKFIALMLALVMVMSLTGCFSGNVGIVFNENGSGKVATSMYIADSFLKEMGKTPEEAFADQDGTIKKKDINGEPYTGIEETQSFANVQELKELLSKTNEETGDTTSVKVETGVSNGKNTVSLTFAYANPETSADSTDATVTVDDAELEEMLKAMQVTIEVTFPGGVKRIDGDRSLYTSDGKTVKINAVASSDEEFLTVVGYLGAAGENGHVVDGVFAEVNKYDGRFKDVPASAWYATELERAFNIGIVDGTAKNKYSPNGNLTKGQVIAMAARLHSLYLKDGKDFSVVSGQKWYQPYVDYAEKNGIIVKGHFTNFDAYTTRAEMAYVFANALPKEMYAVSTSKPDFKDVSKNNQYYASIMTLANAGIVDGVSAGKYAPDETLTRAQAAVFVARLSSSDFRKA